MIPRHSRDISDDSGLSWWFCGYPYLHVLFFMSQDSSGDMLSFSLHGVLGLPPFIHGHIRLCSMSHTSFSAHCDIGA